VKRKGSPASNYASLVRPLLALWPPWEESSGFLKLHVSEPAVSAAVRTARVIAVEKRGLRRGTWQAGGRPPGRGAARVPRASSGRETRATCPLSRGLGNMPALVAGAPRQHRARMSTTCDFRSDAFRENRLFKPRTNSAVSCPGLTRRRLSSTSRAPRERRCRVFAGGDGAAQPSLS
jgi:hypothetical protein